MRNNIRIDYRQLFSGRDNAVTINAPKGCNGASVITYTDLQGRLCAVTFKSKKAVKHDSHIHFNNDAARRTEYINEYFKAIKKQELAKKERQLEKKKYQKEGFDKVKVGDILRDSWGYEQTNVDYYQVIEKKGSATLILRRICCKSIKITGPDSDVVVPAKDKFIKDSEPIARRFNGNSVKTSSFSRAYLCKENEETYRSWGY